MLQALKRLFTPMYQSKLPVEQAIQRCRHNNELDKDMLQRLFYAEWIIPHFGTPEEAMEGLLPVFNVGDQRYVPVFTSVELLKRTLPNVTSFFKYKASTMAPTWPEDCLMHLNPDSDYQLVLTAELVRSLPNFPEPTFDSFPLKITGKTQILIGEPDEIVVPHKIYTDLIACGEQQDGIQAIYRAWIHIQRDGEVPHLAVGVLIRDDFEPKPALDAITRVIYENQPILVDVFFINNGEPNPVSLYMLSEAKPLYWKEPA